MFRIVAILLCIVASSLVASFDLLKVIDKALKVDILPNGSFKVGSLNIPSNILCQSPLLITERLSCHICAVDCTVIHNRYSGQCGTYPGKHGQVCVCNDAPPANGRVPTAVEQCGPLTIDDIPIASSNRLLSSAFETVFIAFANLAVCAGNAYVSTAVCAVDCAVNHQYDYGVCGVENPVQLTPGDIPDDPQKFCNCQFQ